MFCRFGVVRVRLDPENTFWTVIEGEKYIMGEENRKKLPRDSLYYYFNVRVFDFWRKYGISPSERKKNVGDNSSSRILPLTSAHTPFDKKEI